MATATYVLGMTRGTSAEIPGTLVPAAGRTFATPITSLTFRAKLGLRDAGPLIEKSVGAGIAIGSQGASSIVFTVTLDPADTDVNEITEVRSETLLFDLE